MDLNASNAQGVQVGDNNVQHNVWNVVYEVDQQLGAARLGDLAPDYAVTRIRAMGHDRAVIPLAVADVDSAARVLELLLKTDEALAISLLADLSRDKAERLIETVATVSAGWEWLHWLPEAAEAIGDRGADLRWTDPGWLERADCYRLAVNSGSLLLRKRRRKISVPGYRRVYRDGRVYWTEQSGARAVAGAILDLYLSSGECGGQFGIPAGEAIPVLSGPGRLALQRFSSGAIYQHESSVIPVAQVVVDYLDVRGGADQFYPLGPATEAMSPLGTRGWMQRFRGSSNASEATIYDAGKAYGVDGDIGDFYDQLGGASSWLGYPMSNATNLDSNSIQDFEGGTVFAGKSAGVVAVPAGSMKLIRNESGQIPLGFPVSAERPAGNGGDRLQFFENGIVTLRGGKREVWVRPSAVD